MRPLHVSHIYQRHSKLLWDLLFQWPSLSLVLHLEPQNILLLDSVTLPSFAFYNHHNGHPLSSYNSSVHWSPFEGTWNNAVYFFFPADLEQSFLREKKRFNTRNIWECWAVNSCHEGLICNCNQEHHEIFNPIR